MEEKRCLESIITCCALLFVSTVIILSNSYFLKVEGVEEKVPIEVVVSAGDTLWNIAEQYYPKEMDLRPFIDQIKEINGLETVLIVPGQRLQLLVAKE